MPDSLDLVKDIVQISFVLNDVIGGPTLGFDRELGGLSGTKFFFRPAASEDTFKSDLVGGVDENDPIDPLIPLSLQEKRDIQDDRRGASLLAGTDPTFDFFADLLMGQRLEEFQFAGALLRGLENKIGQLPSVQFAVLGKNGVSPSCSGGLFDFRKQEHLVPDRIGVDDRGAEPFEQARNGAFAAPDTTDQSDYF